MNTLPLNIAEFPGSEVTLYGFVACISNQTLVAFYDLRIFSWIFSHIVIRSPENAKHEKP